MERPRPTAILVIAILHIVGGAFGLFGGCSSAVILLSAGLSSPPTAPAPAPGAGTAKGPTPPQMPSSTEMMRYFREHVPGYTVFTVGALAFGLLLDALLLTGAVGLIKMQPWGRTLSLIYAPLSILLHVVSLVYQLVAVLPATHEYYQSMSSSLGAVGSIAEAATYVGVFVGSLVVIYPIFVLVYMLRRSTVAAFRGEVVTPADEGRYEDDPWSEPPPGDAITR